MNFYLEKMIELDADGIDFIPISQFLATREGIPNIVASYTKEEFKNVKYIPKTGYLFYKIIDGKKEYIK